MQLKADVATVTNGRMVCIIFDLDGTLVDSEPACNKAFLDLLPDLSDSVGDLVDRYRGKKLAEILIDLQERLGRRLPSDFEQHYRARVEVLFDSELRSMPGARQMLRSLGVPVCVASSGPAAKIRHALEITRLSKFFDERVFSSYDIGLWKPDPGLFLHAAKAMGFAPKDCVVVEDSSVGIAAALSAGMRPVQYLPNSDESVFPGATPLRHFRQLHRLLDVISQS